MWKEVVNGYGWGREAGEERFSFGFFFLVEVLVGIYLLDTLSSSIFVCESGRGLVCMYVGLLCYLVFK